MQDLEHELLLVFARVQPDKIATMFSSAVAALATFGAALVAFIVGKATSGVLSDEKRAIIALKKLRIDESGLLSFDLNNVGETPARWVEVRVEVTGCLEEAVLHPILSKGSRHPVVVKLASAGDYKTVLRLSYIDFRGRSCRERRIVEIFRGKVSQRPIGRAAYLLRRSLI